jgi:hypothetical protein
MAVESRLARLTLLLRRNPLTIALGVAGVIGVGWYFYALSPRIDRVEHNQTIVREVQKRTSACAEHPHSTICLEGIRAGVRRCLEDLQCSTQLASAPQVSHELREAAQHAQAVNESAEGAGSGGSTTGGGHHPAGAPPPEVVSPNEGGSGPEKPPHHGGGGGHHEGGGGGGGNEGDGGESPSEQPPSPPATPPVTTTPTSESPAAASHCDAVENRS